MLLVRPGEERSVWEKLAPHALPAEVDPAAVADVLRRHRGELAPGASHAAADDDDLVTVVRDALDGTAISPSTLDEFIDAFEVSPRHAARLRSLLAGSASVRVITGQILADLPREIGPPRHDTLALHEMHTLGPDGLPAEHQTIQVIKSTVDSLETYPYRFDTDEAAVEVVRGGHVGDMYRVGDSLYGVDIVLDQPLAAGETALMHYRTTFWYHTPPPPEFRRGVLGTMKDVTLWVRFHPDRVPTRLWSGRWDRLDHATLLDQEPVELDGECSAQVRYDEVSDVIVGFGWSWE
jgi:hypothetical protein